MQGCDRARRMPRSVRDQPSGACQELPRPITLVQRTAIRALVETWLRKVGLCGDKAVRGSPRGEPRGDRRFLVEVRCLSLGDRHLETVRLIDFGGIDSPDCI